MVAITQQQLENASRDADDLQAIVNGAADRPNPGHPDGTVTTRLGGTQPTIAKVMAATEGVYLTPARAAYYGIGNQDDARVFVAQTLELDFVNKYYRDGYDVYVDPTEIPTWNIVGTPAPITDAGMVVSSPASPELEIPGTGDWTVYADVELPANIGERNVFFSYIGSAPERRVLAYRNEDGFYVLELYGDASGQIVQPYMQDTKTRRVRVAVSCSGAQTTMVIDGGPPLVINAPRPEAMLRVWFGTITLGSGTTLPQTFKTILRRNRASSIAELQAMTGGDALSGDGAGGLAVETLRAHENDRDAHDLETVRQDIAIARSEGGIWSLKAADTFAGADGTALGNSETGNLPWSQTTMVRKGGRARDATDGFAATLLNAGAVDGQIEADLYPGAVAAGGEASLFFRRTPDSTWFLMQRAAPGDIGVYIFENGNTAPLTQIIARPVVAGERYIIRFVGPRVFIWRKLNGVAELLFDITDPRLANGGTLGGMRVNGGGSIDNIRFLAREALV